MSGAWRFPRTTPTPSMSPRPDTSLRTTSLICSVAPMAVAPGNPSAEPCPPTRSPASCGPILSGRGLLFVGTETGIYFTLDDGQTWTRMAGGLPVVPVYDLKIKGADLIAGTHGRSFWILDDITPLRALADGKHRNTRLLHRAPRSVPSCISAQWAACEVRSPLPSPSASAAASRPPNCPMASGARASRRRRKSSERRDRLLLAGRQRIRRRLLSRSATWPVRPSSRSAATMKLC